VSPGVFVNEIDNSQLPASPAGIGPVLIGRAEKGPALRPITVSSIEQFVNVFGTPAPGNTSGDIWRRGAWNVTAPTYGAYGAQAYLRNSSPLTYIRLLGNQDDEATAAGKAGWDCGTDGKAWGLIVFEPAGAETVEGVLAAIIYTADADTTVQLSGAIVQSSAGGGAPSGSTVSGLGSNIMVVDTGKAYEFKMVINSPDSAVSSELTAVNFDVGDSKYIRKQLNTTPARTNSALLAGTHKNYWLGETFDRHLRANIPATAGSTFAAIVEIDAKDSGAGFGDDYRVPLQSGQTPAVLGCDLISRGVAGNSYNVEEMPALFTVHALNQPGDWTNRNLKVSIQDIKVSTNESDPYGTFSVVVRALRDSDNVVKVVEQFNDVSLNPNSLNYIARKIGDKYTTWDSTERRYRQRGEWNNVSTYIRVAVNEDIAGENDALLPFGFKGIVKYLDEEEADWTTNVSGNWISGSAVGATGRPATTGTFTGSLWSTGVFIITGSTAGAALTCSVLYPAPELRLTASDGNLSNPTDAYFGYQTTRTAGGSVFDASNIDLLRPRGGMAGDMFSEQASISERSMYFTLDDISGSNGTWVSGSHAAGTSLTNVNGAISGVLDAGFDRFTVPLYAGFDGVNIKELDPFGDRNLTGTPGVTSNYVFNSLLQTIDSIADPEVVEMNLASIPGLKQSGLTTHLINTCEDRADALAVIDLEGGYSPRAEGETSERNNTASGIASVIESLRQRALNTSYACAFYPWVRARDTINGANVWLPPSVAAIGTFSSSQRKTQVWFAPAGFNRGGLTEGAAGIPITDVAHQLRRIDRDNLYSANINPIAKFPNEGIVIFGQKTLQVTPSALDRINVRRLMIFVKKRISQVAATILFDPNVSTTWARFISAATPILADIKTNFGLSDYKLVLDDTTTTPDLVDRNIMYARIFLKPTRAIEYIAIDFNITRTGASFDD
tara:strand:- start:6592 stop:9444 length:2853 start_codon:yes stop_codon:yes gene_type:complete